MQSYEISANEAGQRFDKFLHKFMKEASTGFLYKMLRKKNIVLNGKKAEGREILAVGDTVSFFFSEETYRQFTGREENTGEQAGQIAKHTGLLKEYESAYRTIKGVQVIYEDENILVLDKPAGVLTQKADGNTLSLNEWMIGYLLQKGKLTKEALFTFKPSVQNRLDRNTSGLVLCGISLQGSQLLSRLIKERLIGKYYLTVVKGHIEKSGELTGFLKKDAAHNKVTVSKKEGSAILTAYRPLSSGRDCTCLEVTLITGKTHQIRAHMASIGHPVLGDLKYGKQTDFAEISKKVSLKHQLLHAYKVVFPALDGPFEALSNRAFVAELPPVFKEVLDYGNMEFQRP